MPYVRLHRAAEFWGRQNQKNFFHVYCQVTLPVAFILHYKDSGLAGALIATKKLADELQIAADDKTFKHECSMRCRKTNRQFSYEAMDEAV